MPCAAGDACDAAAAVLATRLPEDLPLRDVGGGGRGLPGGAGGALVGRVVG